MPVGRLLRTYTRMPGSLVTRCSSITISTVDDPGVDAQPVIVLNTPNTLNTPQIKNKFLNILPSHF